LKTVLHFDENDIKLALAKFITNDYGGIVGKIELNINVSQDDRTGAEIRSVSATLEVKSMKAEA
jgi:hypothetical protein